MNKFIYKGDECILGRFGQVRKNDLLILTDQEAESVVNDRKRFVLVSPDEKELPKPGTFIALTNKMTPLQREAAEAANKAEQERLDQLEKANDAETVETLEIKTKTWDQLVAMAEHINDGEKRRVIDVGQRTSKPELIRQILVHRRNQKMTAAAAAAPPAPEPDEDED